MSATALNTKIKKDVEGGRRTQYPYAALKMVISLLKAYAS
jgi:hypothetical protein